MLAPVRTVAPVAPPVSLSEVKAHCRVDGTDSDAVLTALLNAAVDHLDGYTGILGRAMVTQTWRQDFDAFSQCLPLPIWPVASISSVTWRNTAGQLATVSSAEYALRSDAGGLFHVRFKNDFAYPTDLNQTAAVSVTYVAGTAAADVPAALKVAIMLLVSHWNENREAVSAGAMSELPMAVNALIAPYRVWNI
jgi:uncharacterized phiE125 gp8 family phage protein